MTLKTSSEESAFVQCSSGDGCLFVIGIQGLVRDGSGVQRVGDEFGWMEVDSGLFLIPPQLVIV